MHLKAPSRVLLTVDAVGGVWQYTLGLARALDRQGIACLLVGFGPRPRDEDAAERDALGLRRGALVWTGVPLDWMVQDPAALHDTAATIEGLAREWRADLLHLNLPSQAAQLTGGLPLVVAAHSCVPSWWDAVRGGPPPAGWRWHRRMNADGFARADAVVVPSASHGAALGRVYGPVDRLCVVHNATPPTGAAAEDKQDVVLAAGRWWDDGKNGAVLDQAAAASPWPVLMAGALTSPAGGRVRLRHGQALGAVAPAALATLMRRASVFAAPSVYEPFGLAVLEAASHGAALVLADIPTFRELWPDAAVFVPARDPAAYAAAFAALAEDPVRRKELGRRAMARAAHFTPERQMQAMLDVYGTAMARRRTPVRQVA